MPVLLTWRTYLLSRDVSSGPGWRAEVRPSNHPVSEFDFDVVIGADGRKNTLDGEKETEMTFCFKMRRKKVTDPHNVSLSARESTILFIYFTGNEVRCCRSGFWVKHFLLVLTGSLMVCLEVSDVCVCVAARTVWMSLNSVLCLLCLSVGVTDICSVIKWLIYNRAQLLKSLCFHGFWESPLCEPPIVRTSISHDIMFCGSTFCG